VKHNQITSILLFILILSIASQRPMVADLLSNEDFLTYKKSEVVEAKYSLTGVIQSEIVKVTIEIRNNASTHTSVNIRDRVEGVDQSTLTMLYDTPNPTSIEEFGNLTLITWEDVAIEPFSRVKYQYMAQTWRTVPIAVSETTYVNGKQVDPKLTREIYSVDANVSDTLTIQFTIRNTGTLLYTYNKTASPIFMCTVVALLSEQYLSDIRTSPEANSTSTIADQSLMTWILLLEEPVTLTITSRIEAVNSWRAVPIEPITVQLETVPEKVAVEAEATANSMGVYVERLEEVADILSNLSSLLDQIPPSSSNYTETLQETGNTLKDLSTTLTEVIPLIEDPMTRNIIKRLRDQISELGDEFLAAATGAEEAQESIDELKTTTDELNDQIDELANRRVKLLELSLIVRNQKTPYNAEVSSLDDMRDYEVEITEDAWQSSQRIIASIRFTKRADREEVVNGLALQVSVNQTPISPRSALVQVEGEWQYYNGDLTQLGLIYEPTANTLYLFPRTKVEPADTSNMLIDWAGRTIKLVYDCEENLEFKYILDVEEQYPGAQADPLKSKIVNIINQPYIFAGDLTLPNIEPPPPPTENGVPWTLVLAEFLQSQIVHISFFASFIILGFIYVKLGQEKTSTKMTMTKRREARRIISEIDHTIKMMKEKNL